MMAINKHVQNIIKDLVKYFKKKGKVLTYGVQKILESKESQYTFFKGLGFSTVESLDFSPKENPTYVADLNYPLIGFGKYDLIIDGGTMEHCFNVPSVLSNTVNLTKKDGIVIHINPLNNWIDHSFYQFSPSLYYYFYCPKV